MGCLVTMHRALGAALLLLVLAASSEALAAPLEKVDCKQLNIAPLIAPDADWVECYRAHEARPGNSINGIVADYQVLMADARTHVVHIQTGKSGPNTYFFKDSIESRLKGFDELEKVSEFAGEPEFGDYEMVRFQSNLWKVATDCIGFLKYTHASYTQGGGGGAGSYIVGYDCWRGTAPDRAAVEAMLGSIKFPN
ncbi:MAG TPA: hypothetical protein VHA10_14740 [Hypericibacter adhaerens]|nr:hypothetical protein [Hypericibacter adhaerens]HWA44469.1 hypothetical protein [Hypericibacter adhaerens]